MIRSIASLFLVWFVVGCAAFETSPGRARVDAEAVDFAKHIKPIFEHRCVRCHNSRLASAGLNFQDSGNVLSGMRLGTDQRFLIPGEADRSLIYHAITKPAAHPKMMPGDGWGLNRTQERDLRDWIEQGATWPDGRKGKLREKELRVEFDDYR